MMKSFTPPSQSYSIHCLAVKSNTVKVLILDDIESLKRYSKACTAYMLFGLAAITETRTTHILSRNLKEYFVSSSMLDN